MNKKGWIGVDLDGTLAGYDHWRGVDHIGAPILRMVNQVKVWIDDGWEVRIFTARVNDGLQHTKDVIQDWTEQHIGQRLEVTNVKDFDMVALWDDRAVSVEKNTGHVMWHGSSSIKKLLGE